MFPFSCVVPVEVEAVGVFLVLVASQLTVMHDDFHPMLGLNSRAVQSLSAGAPWHKTVSKSTANGNSTAPRLTSMLISRYYPYWH